MRCIAEGEERERRMARLAETIKGQNPFKTILDLMPAVSSCLDFLSFHFIL